jgi:hypothetical protein
MTLIMPLAGLRLRADAVERRNFATSIAASGALLGTSLCYAGGNIGGGQTIWSTILPALLATGTWFAAWMIVEALTGVSESIAIDRDAASAWRLAGFLVSSGLVLGRAVAGDYHSAAETLRDFATEGWPVIVAIVAIAALQPWAKPTPQNPSPSARLRGIIPAMAFVLAAALYAVALGRWRGK